VRALVFFVVVTGCSIPDTKFGPTPDSGGNDGHGAQLAIVPSVTALDVDEGSTAPFTVALSQAPSAPLTVQVSTEATTKLGLSVPELQFTPDNFAQPQSVTASGLADADTVTESAAITLAASGVDPVIVQTTVHDLDQVTIVTDSGTALMIDEGGSATVHVHLSAQPTGDVSVSAILGAGPVTVSPAMRVFTAANYDADQTFTFSAPVDANTVSESQGLTLRADNVADKLVSITDVDHDVQAISVNPTSATVTEQGSAIVLNVSLTQQPAANVTVTVTTTTGQAAISTNQLTFTPANYATNQPVQITAPDDVDTVDGSDTIKLHANVGGVTDRSIAVTIKDNDVQAILEDAPQPLGCAENGTCTFNATLKFKPAANVVVNVTSLANGVATATPGTLTFTPTDYDQPHQVTVHGTDDNNLATNATSIRLFEATIGMTDVGVSVSDDDQQKIVLSRSTLTVPEGMSGSFDVSLQFDPGATVTVSLADTNATALPIDKSSLTFTSANFATPQRVTVSPPVDSNNVSETATITASGAAAPLPQTVMCTATDATTIVQYGFPNPFTGTASLAKGSVIAYQIVVDASTTLDSFGVFVPAGSGDFRMALYADAGGVPGALVAEMPVRQAITPSMGGTQIGNIQDVAITVGKYWVTIRVGQTTAVGQSPSITGAQCFRNLTIPSLDDPWPTTFGGASCQTDLLMNLWITTYHQ
jgi:hypothetical protein